MTDLNSKIRRKPATHTIEGRRPLHISTLLRFSRGRFSDFLRSPAKSLTFNGLKWNPPIENEMIRNETKCIAMRRPPLLSPGPCSPGPAKHPTRLLRISTLSPGFSRGRSSDPLLRVCFFSGLKGDGWLGAAKIPLRATPNKRNAKASTAVASSVLTRPRRPRIFQGSFLKSPSNSLLF